MVMEDGEDAMTTEGAQFGLKYSTMTIYCTWNACGALRVPIVDVIGA